MNLSVADEVTFSDQNFDEMRFKAYRELGYIVARGSSDLEKLASRRPLGAADR